jgi:hypothetical protein
MTNQNEVITSLFQVEFCLKGLLIEQKTGMRMSRISARDCAKRILGYTSRQKPSYDVLIAKMTEIRDRAREMYEEERLAELN